MKWKYIFIPLLIITHSSIAQLIDDKLYVFPNLLVNVDTSQWRLDNYNTFLNSLQGIAEIKSKKDPLTLLSIDPSAYIMDTVARTECKCYADNYRTYPSYSKILQKRKLVIRMDTFHVSIHESRDKKITFHIGTCKTDPSRCFVRISAVGSAADSVVLKESVIQASQHLQFITAQKADSLFQLPLTMGAISKKTWQQLNYYDRAWQKEYERSINSVHVKNHDQLIKEIKESHLDNLGPLGWTKLQDLNALSLDSLIRIRQRYYHLTFINGADNLRLVSHFFPPQFTYNAFQQSLNKLVRGQFTMDEVADYYNKKKLSPGDAIYFNQITGSTNDYPLIHFRKMVVPFFTGYNIVGVNPPSAPQEKTLVFKVIHKNIDRKREEGYLIYQLDGDHYKKEFVPPISSDDKKTSLEEIELADPYRVRKLKDWNNDYTYQVRKIYLLDHRKDSCFWINYSLPVLNDSSYAIKFQFYGEYEDTPVINKPHWTKTHPGEHPDNYYKAYEVKDDADLKTMDKDKTSLDNLMKAVSPKERIYTYSYLAVDINKDGKKELISFSISNGQLVFWKCFNNTPKGLVALATEKTKSQIKLTAAYQKLLKRSLMATDISK